MTTYSHVQASISNVYCTIAFILLHFMIYRRMFDLKDSIIKSLKISLLAWPIWEIPLPYISQFIWSKILPRISYNKTWHIDLLFHLVILFNIVVMLLILIEIYSKVLQTTRGIATVQYMILVVIEFGAGGAAQSHLGKFIIYALMMVLLWFLIAQNYYVVYGYVSTRVKRNLCFYVFSAYLVLYVLNFGPLGYNVYEELSFRMSVTMRLISLFISLVMIGYIYIAFLAEGNHQKELKLREDLVNAQENTIEAMGSITEAKSGETGQHVRRCAEYAAILGAAMGMDPEETRYFRQAAMLHDIGKLMIPNEILEKPGKLTDEEFAIVKKHAEYGGMLLATSKGKIMEMGHFIASEHHERWDGKGYPKGLSGKDISLYARIVSVADVYDALTSERCYKKAWEESKARVEILNQSGKQFDPEVVHMFDVHYPEILKIKETYKDPV